MRNIRIEKTKLGIYYIVSITKNKKKHYVGRFNHLDEAKIARDKKEKELGMQFRETCINCGLQIKGSTCKKKYCTKCLTHRKVRASRICGIKLREMAIDAYGAKCQCPGCNIKERKFLTIDHIFNDGKYEKHRSSIYLKLKRLGYPKDKYQLLCYNCNITKSHYGQCPHQKEAL